MKKLLAILLVLCMSLSLAACGDAAVGGDDEAVGQDEVSFTAGTDTELVNAEELPRFKIAFSYASFTDKLGEQFRNSLQYLGDAYNVEMVFFEAGTGDEAVTNLESILAGGDIDGVIQVGGSTAQVAVADKYGVPYVFACGFPPTAEEAAACAAYDVFLGGVVDDDEWAGVRMTEALYEAGCRNICFSGLTEGFVKSHDDRRDGVHNVVAEHDDLTLLAENFSMAEWANDVASFNAAYPEMDGYTFSAMTDAVYLAMESEGIADGSIKVSAVDISSQTGTYFKNGVQVWTCGGQYATAMTGWAVLYNYLIDGTKIIPDPATPLVRPYIEITSYEDYENYVKYVECPLPTYNVEEIAQMIHYFNPDVTYATYEELAKTYTLEDIIARHGDEIE